MGGVVCWSGAGAGAGGGLLSSGGGGRAIGSAVGSGSAGRGHDESTSAVVAVGNGTVGGRDLEGSGSSGLFTGRLRLGSDFTVFLLATGPPGCQIRTYRGEGKGPYHGDKKDERKDRKPQGSRIYHFGECRITMPSMGQWYI